MGFLRRECFRKKILGIDLTKKEAIDYEVKYHKQLKVDMNPDFFNLARQTSEKFSFDNTGRVFDEESNKKRSESLLN